MKSDFSKDDSHPIPMSVVIIASNAESTIRKCLVSVKGFEEVIVYVNNSVDQTEAIATSFANTKVITGPFLGFGPTKRHAVSLAKHDWVFVIDADEVLSRELIGELRSLKACESTVYAIWRKNHYGNKYIRGCGWQNDFQSRIFNRITTNFKNDAVHETVDSAGLSVVLIKKPLYHYPFDSISQLLTKADRYSSLFADQHGGSKNSSPARAFLSATFVFLKSYIFRYGFIDGREGLVISCFNAFGSFLKYIKLWEASR